MEKLLSNYGWNSHADDFTPYQVAICHALSGHQTWMPRRVVLELFPPPSLAGAEAELNELIELGVVLQLTGIIALAERL